MPSTNDFLYLYMCVGNLLGIGLWRKNLNVNPETYLGKGAAAGVQDVYSQEAYHLFFDEKQSKIIRNRNRMLEGTTRC